jgi:hypothetical protein
MTQISGNGNPFIQQISQKMGQFGQDGRITRSESKELKEWIAQSGLPAEDQAELGKMVDALKDATNGSFLFFNWKSDISPSEMSGLLNISVQNNLAAQLLEEFSDASKEMPTSDRTSFGRFMDSILEPNQVKFNPGQQAQAPENIPSDPVPAPPGGQSPGSPPSVSPVSGPEGSRTPGQRNPNAPVASQFFNPNGTRSDTGRADCGLGASLSILHERGYSPQISDYSEMRQLLPPSRRGADATTRDDQIVHGHRPGTRECQRARRRKCVDGVAACRGDRAA